MTQEVEQHPERLDYAAAAPAPPDRLSRGEKICLIPAAVPLLTLVGYRIVVALSPWTFNELCIAADNCTPISVAATKLTDFGVWLHFTSLFASLPLGLAAFVLLGRALLANRWRSATVAAVMVICCVFSFLLGTDAISLAGF